MSALPESIAIAGAWGYIGGKFLEAARALGLRTFVYDSGTPPRDMDLQSVTVIADEDEFYRLNADVFHLALHPEHRGKGMDLLLQRSAKEPVLLLVEKPMAQPEHPEDCIRIVRACNDSKAVVLYDFPELFDPMTRRIPQFLSGFRDLRIERIYTQRSKDRENPGNPRNYKKMVPIEYQESVHCLAFVLNLLGGQKGGLDSAFSEGLSVQARSESYNPPNPQDYPYVVDGKCDFSLSLGSVSVDSHTDFKSKAELKKLRTIQATGDDRPIRIEVDYLEGRKYLLMDEVDSQADSNASSYESVISTLWHWYTHVDRDRLMRGPYPNPEFSRLTYQLASVIWKSTWTRDTVRLSSLKELKEFDAGFARAMREFPHYHPTAPPGLSDRPATSDRHGLPAESAETITPVRP